MRLGIVVIAVASAAVVGGSAPATSPASPASCSPPAVHAAERAAPPAPALAVAVAAPSLVVRVLSHGRPVDGAEVRISSGSELPPTLVRTDREGLARVAALGAGPFDVWAVGPQLASPISHVAVPPREPVELALEPASTVSGELTWDGAAPTSGTVQLVPLDLDHAVRTAPVAEGGRFVFDGIPAGRWRVEVTSPGFLQLVTQELRVARPRETARVRLEHAAEISGTVVDVHGAPVTNASVVLRRQGARARPVAPVLGALRWVYPFAERRSVPTNEGARFGAPRPGTRLAECGDGHCGIDLVMPRGTVVHATGDGVVLVATSSLGSEAGRFVAIDHGDGLVTMYMHLDQVRDGLEVGRPIRAGTPIGTVGSTGFDPTRSVPHLHFALTEQRGGRTWYLDPEPMLRRAVVLAAPRALEVASTGDDALAFAPRPHVAPAASDEITTDARGRFRVPDLSPGSYVAVAFSPDLAPGASPTLVVPSGGAVHDVVVTLAPGTIVRGHVTTRNGPVSGATVIASTGFGETTSKVATTSSNAQGEFVLRALAGTVTVSVAAPRYGESSRTLDLSKGDASRADFMLVVEDAQLRGVVRSPSGAVAGAQVRIIDGPTRRTAFTDGTGQFTIQPVATGHYVLEVTAPDYPTRRLSLDSDRFGEVALEQGGGVLVRVGDARDGADVAGVVVDARGPGGATATRTTDAHGLADLTGLAVGTWSLSVRARSYAPISRDVTIRASRVPQDLRIDLVKAATLAGVVRDRRGMRVAGAKVWSGVAQTQTDGDGNFRLPGVAVGAIQLEASLGERHGQLGLRLVPGDERVTIELELAE